MLELIVGLVPGLPEAARQAIVARADGVPLYAVETVRMLVADGRLVLRDGVFTPNGDLTQLAVPDSLTALIAARLDALDPADRSLILDASVLGQSFTPAALAAVSGTDQAQLVPRLRALVRREILVQEADSRSPELGQFAFVQSLIREVAYGTLARRDRKLRHLAAARWFESLGLDELSGALAGQYLAAHSNAAEDDEAAALAAQARIALRAAADRATALGAFEQSSVFLRQALAVSSDPHDAAELLEEAGIAASHAGRHTDIGAVAARRARPAGGAGRPRRGGPGDRSPRGYAPVSGAEPLRRSACSSPPAPPSTTWARRSGRSCVSVDSSREPTCTPSGGSRPWTSPTAVLASAERLDAVDIVADVLITRGSALVPVRPAVQRHGRHPGRS